MAIDYLVSLRSDADALVVAVSGSPLTTPVKTCPDWDLLALVRHVGRVHRWATAVATQRVQAPPPPTDPVTPDNAIEFLKTGAAGVEAALLALPADAECWNFTRTAQVGGFWHRRQALETAVHRWDAQDAVGEAVPFAPALAADGVDEFLTVLAPLRLANRDGIDVGGSIHLHATDVDPTHDGEWMVHTDDGVLRVTAAHAKGDVALRGPVSSLFLYLWGRVTPGAHGTEVFGDAAVLDRFALIISG